MNDQLSYLITPENILSYANACIDIAAQLIFLQKEGYKNIIIPSRGAYPFYQGAITSFYVRTDSGLTSWRFTSQSNVWLLPYTADFGDANVSVNSKQIRKFWTIILANYLHEEVTPYTKFYSDLVIKVGSRYTINTNDLKFENKFKKEDNLGKKFLFIDTAISGQAISEIIECFYELNLENFFIILIIDKNGKKLKSKYVNIIEREVFKGKLKKIYVENIFSEDTSPLLNSGISSLVFPTLIERSFYEIKEFRDNESIGAGLWFVDSLSNLKKFNINLNTLRGILSTLIFRGLRNLLTDTDIFFEEAVEFEVAKMKELSEGFSIFEQESTKGLIYDRIAPVKTKTKEMISISTSHVVRINIEQKFISFFIRDLNKKL